jgi:hypothetical protein
MICKRACLGRLLLRYQTCALYILVIWSAKMMNEVEHAYSLLDFVAL